VQVLHCKDAAPSFIVCEDVIVKFIHFSDSHTGVESRGKKDPETGINLRVMDYLNTLDSIVDFAEDENVDLAIFTGDAFHTNKPSPLYLNEFSKRISRLSKQCTTVLIVGNHDMEKLHSSSAVEIYSSLNIPNVIVGNTLDIHIVDTKSGKVQILTVPYPTKESLSVGNSDQSRKSVKDLLKYKLNMLCKKLDKELPTILAGHMTVLGSMSGSESNYLSRLDPDIDLEELAKPCFDYVALGHIHKYQNLTENNPKLPPVIYSGSIERVSFNEENEDKGFILGEINDLETIYEFILVDARPYKTLEVFSEDRDPTKLILRKISKTDLHGAIVRYVIHVPEDYLYLVDEGEIQSAILSAGAFCIGNRKIDVIRKSRENSRSYGLSSASTKDELLLRYFNVTHIDEKENKILLKMAHEIINLVENSRQEI